MLHLIEDKKYNEFTILVTNDKDIITHKYFSFIAEDSYYSLQDILTNPLTKLKDENKSSLTEHMQAFTNQIILTSQETLKDIKKYIKARPELLI